MSAKVLNLPTAVQADAIEFLEAVVADLKSGVMPSVERGVMVLGFETGMFSVWDFGPKNGGAYTSMAMCTLGQQMFVDKILGE